MRRAPSFVRGLAIWCAILGIVAQGRAGITDIYSLRGSPTNNIYQVNIETGNDSVAFTNYPGGSAATLATRPSDGLLFYVINATNGTLYSWNPATPATPPVAIGSGVGASVGAALRLTFSQAGTLYYMVGDSLYTIDTTTGLATLFSTITGTGGGGDMAFGPDGTFYIINNSQLFTAPVGGGAATFLGTITGATGNIIGLAFDPANRMVILCSDASNSAYYFVNLSTFAATLIGPASGAGATGDLTTPPHWEISGTVFDDVNYGGGAGRSLAASGGVPRPNATVELYDNAGNFVVATTTDAAGFYRFAGTIGRSYTVRVVNSTVTSARTGAIPGLLPVQTFRTDASSGTAVAVTDRVGGETPTVADPGPGSTTLPANSQSITAATVGAAGITGVDFGFNFDTIVNVNDSGQGSLRQFIANANALDNGTLAQVGQTAGKEVSIFMISDGAAHPGLRAGLANLLTGGVAVIVPTSALLPPITGPDTIIDGTTQTVDVGDSNSGTLGTGGAVGVDGLALSTVNRPEVQLNDSGLHLAQGLDLQAANTTIRGLAIYGFGNNRASGNGEGNIRVGAVSGAFIEQNIIGTSATSFTDPGATRTLGDNITFEGAGGAILRNNLIGYASYMGALFVTSSLNALVEANEIRGNGIGHGNQDGVSFEGNSASGTVRGNLIAGTEGCGVDMPSTAGINTIVNNTITGNGIGTDAVLETPGIRVTANGNLVDRNIISANFGAGVMVKIASTGNQITRNSIFANGTITNKGGGGPSGQLGIDLLTASDAPKTGTTPFITINDNGDADTGGNNLLNFPVVTSAASSGGNLVLQGFARPGSVIEFYIAAPSASGFGQGKTYLTTLTEGSGADADATTGTYTNPVNGLNQGTDTTNKFRFTIPLPGGVSLGTILTATATDGSNNTSEFSGNVTVSMQQISGKIFEDVNYGGGAGRDLTTSSGVVRQNATVELYDSAGAYVSNTTTDATGLYTFPGLATGNYTVRVVNSTVTSSRPGYVAGLLPAETYRTNGLTGSVGTADPNRVGGENPATVDAGAGSPGTVIDPTTGVFTAGLTGQAQSITTLAVGTGPITGIDFGFNFDSVVNVNDSDQGSLRQMFTNANTLGGDASLAQAGLVAAKENVVFMVSNGTSAPGLRATNNYFVGGIATIAPLSPLPDVTSPLVIDAQKQPGWTSTPVIELNGASASGNGLLISTGSSTVRGLIVNRFSGSGIYLITNGSNLVAGNYVGTNSAGTAALANGQGIEVDNSANNVIGGTAAADMNLVAGNTGKGVSLDSAGSTGNVIKGNRIGTNAAGTAAIASNVGVQLTNAPNNTIGGTTAGAGNLISGHSAQGIFIIGTTTGALVEGNLIGTDAAGTAAIANNFGIFIAGPAGNTVGGSAAGARNVISGNFIGLDIQGTTASGNLVAGNYIGTNVAGSGALANTGAGVILSDAPNNVIGGIAAGAGNVISGNIGNGLTLAGTPTVGTLVQGNRIGTDASGIAALGNSGVGVSAGSGGNHDNTIGGSAVGAPNTIAFNGGMGVRIWAGAGQLISRNAIYSNGALGIDLNADGVTPNDGVKNGGQPNSGMDMPVFTSAVLSGGTLNVAGYVGSAPGQAIFAGAAVEIFKSDRDPSTFGEGPVYVGSLTTDANGNFSGPLSAGSLTSADAITGTATDGANNTSEFGTNFNLSPNVSGTVYLDVNHNGLIDSGETGTGLTLYAKIFPSSTPAGPAIQAVAINPATGAYSFSSVTPGTYTIIIDDNNTLADVTPTLPAGYSGTEQPNQTRSNVAVTSAPLANQNFGLIHALPLSGRIFVDTGTSGGTPNDGVLNGAEIGLAAVTVKLTDASGATTYDTATTDGGGNYILYVPQTLANGTQLKVVETNLATYVSTGASLGNTAGTYARATDTITFALAVNTTYLNVNLGDVPDIIFTTDNAQSALPGSTIVYAHTFTAGSAGQVTFSTTRVSAPPIPGWNSTLYRDVNSDGKVDPGDTVITAPITLNTGETIQILVQEVIPAGAPLNAQDTVTVTASHSYTNANPVLSTSAAHTDITTVGNPTTAGLALAKSVDKATALPGETLTYTVAYTNNSSDVLSNVIISDSTPAFTTFLSAGNGPLPNDFTGVAIAKPAVGATGAIRWTFTGTLAPASNGTVTFQVKVEQ